jgi:type VI protein secretion system component VasK
MNLKVLINKEGLSPKSIAVVKLAVWSALLVWMAMILVFAIVGAMVLTDRSKDVWDGAAGNIMSWFLPIWFIYTILFVILLVIRWSSRKLKGGNSSNDDN